MTMQKDKQTEGWVDNLVGALCDPVICFGQNLDRPPRTIMEAINLQRLLENMAALHENRSPIGTDAEAAWYLSSASLEAPLDHDWFEIYMYVFNKTCAITKTEVPEDLKTDKLTNQQINMLYDLKAWIYAKRVEHRKTKARTAKETEKAAKVKEEADLNPTLF
ncbi:MAG: hypothetical protein PHI12_14135 [Dehalococcoidales bacterium]|nr:hypothetical protein [Dehalococcoidales bacterium]